MRSPAPTFLAAAAILLAVLVPAGPIASAANDLRVVSATPQGKLEEPGVDRIQILFDGPIVPLGAAEPTDAPPSWLDLKPALLARWRWAGTSTLIAEPKGPLPGATTYTFRIAAGLEAADGRKLRKEFAFTFSTPPAAAVVFFDPGSEQDPIELARGERGSGGVASFAEGAPILLVWNQPVDDGSVAEHVKATIRPRPAVTQPVDVLSPDAVARLRKDDPSGYDGWSRYLATIRGPAVGPVDFVLEPDPGHPHRVYRIRPRTPWPRAAETLVEITGGTRGLEGPDPGIPAKVTFDLPWPLAPLGVFSRRSREGGALDPDGASLRFTGNVRWVDAAPLVRLRTAGAKEWRHVPSMEGEWYWDNPTADLPLAPLALDGGVEYEVCVDAGLKDAIGGGMAFPWCGTFRTAHRTPGFHLVEGNGVVEWDGPHKLPLSTVNVTKYLVDHRRLDEDELVPALRSAESVLAAPKGLELEPMTVPLSLPPDRWSISPLDLDSALGGRPGVVLSRLRVGDVVEASEYESSEADRLREPRIAFTQVTSLGMTAKISQHEGVLVWVTRLKEAAPVAGAAVVVRDRDNQVVWQGTTDADGLAKTGPEITDCQAFLVTARVGDDLAYAGTGWHEGHRGWDFNLPVDWSAARLVVGFVWADRGIARPGETVHLKAALRRHDLRRLLFLEGKEVTFVVRDSRDQDVAVRKASLDSWGAAETEIEIPRSAPLGPWNVLVGAGYDEGKRCFAADADWPAAPGGAEAQPVYGSFRVAEFRRPKFRVRVTVPPDKLVAGDPLAASMDATYLAGGPMAGASARWTIRWQRSWWGPAQSRWGDWVFLDETLFDADEERRQEGELGKGEGTLDAHGGLSVRLPRVEAPKGFPTRVEVEADVQDVDRQTFADTASAQVLPGEFFVGLKRGPYFVEAKDGAAAEVVAIDLSERPLPGKTVRLALVRRHWESVRRRDVAGRYVFESRPVDQTVAEKEVVTSEDGVPVRFDLGEPGEYAIFGRAKDGRGNDLVSGFSFYVLGAGYTPWRFDQENRIDLVAERPVYAPGETARVLVKSPWERALALVTVERAGVLETRIERLSGTMPVLEVPVRDEYSPNVFVSVVMVRGRVEVPEDPEMVDPGRPAYRVGYCELTVPPRGKKLTVEAKPARLEYRPGERAVVKVRVAGEDGAPRAASVTVWAVDAGVLALTRYKTPDLMSVFYARRGMGVSTIESRSRLVGRRSYGTKGDRAGGGGGAELADRDIRRDFRALAAWRGDVVTGQDGSATLEFVLPDSLTTYRLMAVATAGVAEFGSSEVEFRVTKPVGLEPALPRFLRPGDRARAGVVVRNRTDAGREIEVRAVVASGPVRLVGDATRRVTVPAGGSAEVPFDLVASAPGTASLRFEASSPEPSPERDALEIPLAVETIAPRETVATFFRVAVRAKEMIEVPAEVYPEAGALEVRLSTSEALQAREGLRFLLEYRYGCAEQIASRMLGVAAAIRLGNPLAPKDVGGVPTSAWLKDAVDRLVACQKPDGGFSFWPEGRLSSPALSAHVAWALAAGRKAGASVPGRTLERAATYFSGLLRGETSPWGTPALWTEKVTACFALARLGKPEPPYFQGLYDARGGPLWGRALLAIAMLDANPRDARALQVLQEVRNHLTIEARAARLEEKSPGWGWLFWWSERRGSAIALMALLGGDHEDPTADRLARGILDRLARDSFRQTQDTAWMLQALAEYEVLRAAGAGPRTASATLSGRPLVEMRFEAKEPEETSAAVPMSRLQQMAKATGSRLLPLEVTVDGAGGVHASALLSFAPKGARPPLSQGISVERTFLDANGRPVTGVAAGDDLTVEIAVAATALRRFVAVEAPIPAGVEILDPELQTTGSRGRVEAAQESEAGSYWWSPGFDHVEMRDDRLLLYATELPPGRHAYRVKARATTPGSFAVAPARAEEMYSPEIFGTSSSGAFEVSAGRE
jgi:uncharacterized protein YfaS (alpha-2-macroglobulin family)